MAARPVVLYVLGPPGVGKTTLVRDILARYSDDDPVRTVSPLPKWTLSQDCVAAGHYTGATFDGADTVPYNGARKALEFWLENLADSALTILDGARFSTLTSLAWLRENAPNHAIVGVHLVASDAQLADRRVRRGSNQDPSWMKGASTGARNFAAKIGAADFESTCDTTELADDVLDLVDAASLRDK